MLAATARLASSAIRATCSRSLLFSTGRSAGRTTATVDKGRLCALSAGDLSLLIGCRTSRGDAERGHLTAATGHIGEAGGAKAREKAAKFSAEQVRREIHQHVAVIDFADIGDVRENLSADRDPFLDDPHAVFRRKRSLDR